MGISDRLKGVGNLDSLHIVVKATAGSQVVRTPDLALESWRSSRPSTPASAHSIRHWRAVKPSSAAIDLLKITSFETFS